MTAPETPERATTCPHLRQNRWYQRGQDVGFHCLDCDEHVNDMQPETPTVERFRFNTVWEELTPCADGEWVRHADYLTLHAQLAALQDAVKEWKEAEAAQTATPTKNMDEWLDRSRLVNAAKVRLRALVTPQRESE